MKSHVSRIVSFVTSGITLRFVLLALAIGINSMPAHAQENAWKIDREHSIARLSLGSGPKSVEVGVARVSGKVVYDANDASDPVVNLDIKQEKGQGAGYSEISFNSKRSMLTDDGKVAVVGDLTVTRVERSVTMGSPNLGSADYYGGVYGEPVVHTEKREVTLLLPAEVRPAVKNGAMQLSASTNISREYFPQFLAALAPGNWPNAIVEDEKCTMPSGLPGEDYSGATCTGTTIATTTNAVASGTPAIGEGYYGFDPAVIPDGSQASIALDLRLIHAPAGPSAASTEIAGN